MLTLALTMTSVAGRLHRERDNAVTSSDSSEVLSDTMVVVNPHRDGFRVTDRIVITTPPGCEFLIPRELIPYPSEGLRAPLQWYQLHLLGGDTIENHRGVQFFPPECDGDILRGVTSSTLWDSRIFVTSGKGVIWGSSLRVRLHTNFSNSEVNAWEVGSYYQSMPSPMAF
jgi:hypothetical protein